MSEYSDGIICIVVEALDVVDVYKHHLPANIAHRALLFMKETERIK